jgi:superfamily II DNA or RNA helicase
MRITKGYSFPDKPKMMQLYVAWRIRRDPCFLNLSGTGAGKTLSAVLASRVIRSKMTLIVCPKGVVRRTWEDTIMSAYPDSVLTVGMDAFHAEYDESKHQYLVINYDKFSQPYTEYYINLLAQTKIDFIVLDEIQFIKKRSAVHESLRREYLGKLFTAIRVKNPNIKALGMSATPVINHLSEGISLLSYITGNDYRDDLSDASKIPNAMALHQKLTLISIREMPHYRARVRERFVEVYAPKPDNIRLRYKELLKSPLKIEQYLTEARLPEIIKRIDNRQTIIYTEYVTAIVEPIKQAVKAEGYSYVVYTGEYHEESDLQKFIDKEVKVLISSKPISVGLDGLQKSCNNLIINTLPWTHAGYKQLIGRLHRLGQQEDHVDVHIIKVTMAGFEYDRFKWLRIQFKGDLSDCAVDGRIPKGHLQSREQLQLELIKWLERLERNEISIFERRKLIIPLNPAEQLAHERIISEFTKLNRSWNISTSKTVHENIEKNPQKLLEYHNQLDILRSRWSIDPVNVIADKINNLRIPANVIMKLVIGDFGAGKCRLADLLKENKVHCFDHDKILDKRITPCNMKHTGLKPNSLGIAVFSQSLMCVDWPDYIKEAKRTLAKNGYLIIAEVTRTLKKSDEDGQGEGRLYKLKEVLEEEGFTLEDEDPRDRFTFITAMKK